MLVWVLTQSFDSRKPGNPPLGWIFSPRNQQFVDSESSFQATSSWKNEGNTVTSNDSSLYKHIINIYIYVNLYMHFQIYIYMTYVNLYTLHIFTPTKKWQKYWAAQEHGVSSRGKLTWFHGKCPFFHLPYHNGCSIATLFFCPSVWPYVPWSTLPILGMANPPLIGISEFPTNR